MELELPRLLANSYRSLIEHFLSNIKRTPRSSPLRYTATPSDTVSSGFRLSLKLAPRRLKSLNVPLSRRDCGFAADCEAGFRIDRGDDLPAKCVFTIRKPLRLLLRPELFPTLTSRRPAVALGFTTLSRNLRLYDLFSTQVFCQFPSPLSTLPKLAFEINYQQQNHTLDCTDTALSGGRTSQSSSQYELGQVPSCSHTA